LTCEIAGFGLECLESRTHLAAAPLLADYEPLVPGAQWVYNSVDDGKRTTDTETISPQMKRMHGQRVFEQIDDSSDGSRSWSYVNVSASGQLQQHGGKDEDSNMWVTPPMLFPKLAKPGQRSVSDGKTDLILFGYHMTGRFHSEMEVLGQERVTVPAGTFSTIRVRGTMELTAEYHKRGVNISVKLTGSGVDWLAKGVGTVKDNSVSHIKASVNDKHKTVDSKSRSVLKSYSIPPH